MKEPFPGEDGYAIVTCNCLDEHGVEVPDAEILVSFICNGGKVVATGSDICDHIPPMSPDRRMRTGIELYAVKWP